VIGKERLVAFRRVTAASLVLATAACVSNGKQNAARAAVDLQDAPSPFVVVQPEPEPAATQDELAVGGFLFANICAKCHGGVGQGARRITIVRGDYAGIKEIIT
jgi:hypothetical protein